MPEVRLSLYDVPRHGPRSEDVPVRRRVGWLTIPTVAFLAFVTPAGPVQAGRFPSQDLSPAPAAPVLPPCTCRAQGRVFQMGETACLETADGPRPALCVMDQNVTSWRRMPGICPSARAGGRVL